MMTIQQRIAVVSTVALAVLAGPLGMMTNAALVTQHDSEVGVVTTATPNLTWSNQVVGGSADLYGQFSATPAVIAAATPLGQDALRFDGAASNPDQLKFGATNLFDSAPSLTFMMVVKPTTSATSDWFLQSKVSNAHNSYGWGLYHDATGNFGAQARSTVAQFNSTIADSTVGGLQDDWMILTGVYDSGATSLQLFLTDIDGLLHTGGATTVSGGLANGTHDLTSIGADINRVGGGAADIAAIRIWNEALSPAARVAAETSLFNTYIEEAPAAGTVVSIK